MKRDFGCFYLIFRLLCHVFLSPRSGVFNCNFQSTLLYFLTPIGNFDVLLSNIFVLTLSSAFITIAHLRTIRKFIIFALLLGFAFLINQIDETFAPMTIDSFSDSSATIACLYVHMSHLIFCTFLFSLCILFNFADNPSTDALVRFAVLYWHLVEIVWIIILLGFMCI